MNVLKLEKKNSKNKFPVNTKTNPKQLFSNISSKSNARSVIEPLENDNWVLEADDTTKPIFLFGIYDKEFGNSLS